MRYPRRPSRRRAFLATYGAIYALIGLGILLVPPTPVQRAGLALLVDPIPYMWYAGLWAAAAAVAVVAATAPPRRWDTAGFAALVAPPALWAAAYLIASLRGQAIGWLAALAYAAFAAASALVAGMPEDPPTGPP